MDDSGASYGWQGRISEAKSTYTFDLTKHSVLGGTVTLRLDDCLAFQGWVDLYDIPF